VDAMTASPASHPDSPPRRTPLRIRLRDSATAAHIDGAWWPQSRDLQVEAADLIDHFPRLAGHVSRLLFSRPDWDNPVLNGRGVRRIQTRRGQVKVGSFPADNTQLMVVILSTGRRLNLRVIPSATDPVEADRLLQAVAWSDPISHSADPGWAHWQETPPPA
jgi:hypothetical protein